MRSAIVLVVTLKRAALAMRPALVVFMHGLGDTPHGWADTLREAFRERLPHVRFELPEAPRAPVTCNGGAKMTSWMDLREIPVTADAYDDEPTLTASVARIHAVIDASGVPPDRVVVGGFSQGAAMAFLSTVRYPHRLGGCAMLSGWPPLASKEPIATCANARTPFFVAHGLSDSVVLPECAQFTAETLSAAGTPARLKLYPGMAHSSCDREMVDLAAFLEEVLPK
jgi:predicted esterase